MFNHSDDDTGGIGAGTTIIGPFHLRHHHRHKPHRLHLAGRPIKDHGNGHATNNAEINVPQATQLNSDPIPVP